MYYESPAKGTEISCVMYGINSNILSNTKKLEEELIKALKEDKFDVLDKISHTFNPQGYTLEVLLADSHVAIHTYPEHNSLYFNLYSCRGEHDGEKTFEIFREYISPKDIDFLERDIIVNRV